MAGARRAAMFAKAGPWRLLSVTSYERDVKLMLTRNNPETNALQVKVKVGM